jgi:uncharacterized membrane protein
MIQLISLVMLAYSFFLIQTTLPRLPKCIPTHFNAAGVADGWGSPDMLWMLLGAQALTCVVFLGMPYLTRIFPGAVHFGPRKLKDFPPAQQGRMLSMLNDMGAYMGIVMNVFFVLMLLEITRAASQPNPRIHPLLPMAIFIGGTIGIMLYYTRIFIRVAKGEDVDGHPNSHGPQLTTHQPDVLKKKD